MPSSPTGTQGKTLLVVDDNRAIQLLITRYFSDLGMEVIAVGDAENGLEILSQRRSPISVCLLDIDLPGMSGLEALKKYHEWDGKLPVIFITGSDDSETAIEMMKAGAFDYLVKPLDCSQLLERVLKAIGIREEKSVPFDLPRCGAGSEAGEQLIGKSSPMQEVYKAIGRVAPQDVTVLIQGESGTGKELVARAIYQHSRRAQGPFLAVNCAAIPETLLESELFGHEKGAFTGALQRRIGKFEQCMQGTIFLDEIGDMPKVLQGKILRLLQSQEFERVGGNETVRTDVRVIAATNCILEMMVEKAEFREDLYYRLKGFLISVPPLRQRPEDLPMLLQHFLARYRRELGKNVESISPEALKILCGYSWPGNVRELENVLKQSLINSTGCVLLPEFLPDLAGNGLPLECTAADDGHLWDFSRFIDHRLREGSENLHSETVELLEQFLVRRVLQETRGNQSQAARILGITRGSLRNKVRAFGISIEQVVRIPDEELLPLA
jgi:DNA-binding NtrC family response regulator